MRGGLTINREDELPAELTLIARVGTHRQTVDSARDDILHCRLRDVCDESASVRNQDAARYTNSHDPLSRSRPPLKVFRVMPSAL